MFRVSTSEFTYELPSDVSEYKIIRVSYQQRDVLLTKQYVVGGTSDSGIVADGDTVVVSLTQEETAMFRPGFAYTQVKVLTLDDKTLPSNEFRIIVQSIEDETIMSGGGGK